VFFVSNRVRPNDFALAKSSEYTIFNSGLSETVLGVANVCDNAVQKT